MRHYLESEKCRHFWTAPYYYIVLSLYYFAGCKPMMRTIFSRETQMDEQIQMSEFIIDKT